MKTETLKPFFTYYGGKYRIAPKYPKPTEKKIIEPFAGSAGYSLRYPDHKVVLFDKDPIISGLWQYLISVSESEILSLPIVVDHVDNLRCAKEACWLIGFWLNKGSVSPGKSHSAWSRRGDRPNSFWGESIRFRIANQLKYIRHWKAFNSDYTEIIDNNLATWFIDPPYCSRAGSLYRFSKIDYKHLAQWCLSRSGQIIICESDQANWLKFQPLCQSKVSESKRGGKKLNEVIFYREKNKSGDGS